MDVYLLAAAETGSTSAVSLASRLREWHDLMVRHARLRRLRPCEEECPCSLAPALWKEACATFGGNAQQLAFLKRYGEAQNPED